MAAATVATALRLVRAVPHPSGAAPHAAADGIGDEALHDALHDALDWLRAHRNPDGGWGDTPDSPSNLPTTFLAWSSLRAAAADEAATAGTPDPARDWLEQTLGVSLTPAHLVARLELLYGPDRTFAAPILMMGALNGVLGPPEQAWKRVPSLPFILALLPHALFRHLRLGVVSYALPALIAVGLCRWVHHGGAAGGTLRRHPLAPFLLRRLATLQPPHGGFLEAIPLSAFVVMALTAAGHGGHSVTRRSLGFLLASQRRAAGGGWPIDTNLDTWVTSLAVQALGSRERIATLLEGRSGPGAADAVLDYLMRAQTRARHPYTQAAPGGWAWTDRPGAVPDADDTAGALVALAFLAPPGHARHAQALQAALRGVDWLLAIQNSDGGFPTFCRGWGRLPFDRSAADISAHALTALDTWLPRLEAGKTRARVRRARDRCLDFLLRAQARDGSWEPLWFGDQADPDGRNPVFGTARVVKAVADCASDPPERAPAVERGRRFLRLRQHPSGAWGVGEGSLEETGLALQALPKDDPAGVRARRWLLERTAEGCPARPIGLYFARLWYAEELYPCVWSLGGWPASSEP